MYGLKRIYSNGISLNDMEYGTPTLLVYDSVSRIVYYKMEEESSRSNLYHVGSVTSKTGYMSPYISKNGKFCRFGEDNKIYEIP